MARAKKVSTADAVEVQTSSSVSVDALASALQAAIQASKPAEKKTIFNRPSETPWTPPPGQERLKLKRKMYQHGLPISEKFVTNEQIALMNKLRPGVYLDGHVRVTRRKDKGVDISYPVKSPAQRLRLVNGFGVRNFTELLQRLNEEADKPKRSEFNVADED